MDVPKQDPRVQVGNIIVLIDQINHDWYTVEITGCCYSSTGYKYTLSAFGHLTWDPAGGYQLNGNHPVKIETILFNRYDKSDQV